MHVSRLPSDASLRRVRVVEDGEYGKDEVGARVGIITRDSALASGSFLERKTAAVSARAPGWDVAAAVVLRAIIPEDARELRTRDLRGASASGVVSTLGLSLFFQLILVQAGVLKGAWISVKESKSAGARELFWVATYFPGLSILGVFAESAESGPRAERGPLLAAVVALPAWIVEISNRAASNVDTSMSRAQLVGSLCAWSGGEYIGTERAEEWRVCVDTSAEAQRVGAEATVDVAIGACRVGEMAEGALEALRTGIERTLRTHTLSARLTTAIRTEITDIIPREYLLNKTTKGETFTDDEIIAAQTIAKNAGLYFDHTDTLKHITFTIPIAHAINNLGVSKEDASLKKWLYIPHASIYLKTLQQELSNRYATLNTILTKKTFDPIISPKNKLHIDNMKLDMRDIMNHISSLLNGAKPEISTATTPLMTGAKYLMDMLNYIGSTKIQLTSIELIAEVPHILKIPIPLLSASLNMSQVIRIPSFTKPDVVRGLFSMFLMYRVSLVALRCIIYIDSIVNAAGGEHANSVYNIVSAALTKTKSGTEPLTVILAKLVFSLRNLARPFENVQYSAESVLSKSDVVPPRTTVESVIATIPQNENLATYTMGEGILSNQLSFGNVKLEDILAIHFGLGLNPEVISFLRFILDFRKTSTALEMSNTNPTIFNIVDIESACIAFNLQICVCMVYDNIEKNVPVIREYMFTSNADPLSRANVNIVCKATLVERIPTIYYAYVISGDKSRPQEQKQERSQEKRQEQRPERPQEQKQERPQEKRQDRPQEQRQEPRQEPRQERPQEQRQERPQEQRQERPQEQRQERPQEQRQEPRQERPQERPHERPQEQRQEQQQRQEPRQERSQQQRQEQRPQEQRPQEQRPQEQRPQEQRPQEQRPQEQRPQEQRPQEQRPQEQRPQEQRPQEQRQERQQEQRQKQPQEQKQKRPQDELVELLKKPDQSFNPQKDNIPKQDGQKKQEWQQKPPGERLPKKEYLQNKAKEERRLAYEKQKQQKQEKQ